MKNISATLCMDPINRRKYL